MLGYKVALNVTQRVIITLEIPEDAFTNIGRSSIVLKESAKYRTNKAKVIAIEDADGKKYDVAISGFYNDKKLTYKLNTVVEVKDYNSDKHIVCGSGIHFFLNKRVAELYNIDVKNMTGLYQSWCINGQLWTQVNYINGLYDGLYQVWYPDGKKQTEIQYVNGVRHGLHQQWHYNGKKYIETNYVNGRLHGLYQSWYDNGYKSVEVNYIDGELVGPTKKYYNYGVVMT